MSAGKNRPWMPLYVFDYIADTTHLTTTEHGAYFLLIMHYWIHGSLPNNEETIRRITKMTVRQWVQSRDVIRSLFGNGWCHKRVDMELAQVIEKSRSNSANAKRRLSARPPAADTLHTTDKKESDSTTLARHGNFKDMEKAGLLLPVASYSEMDFISTDGSVHFDAAELEAMKTDYPALKDVRAMVRQGVRWAAAEGIDPFRRKVVVLSWLSKKNLAAEAVRARESREAEREANRDQRQPSNAHRQRGQAVLP